MRKRIDFKTRSVALEQSGKKKKKLARMFLFLGALFLILFLLWKMALWFRIQTVECIYDGEECPAEYKQKTDVLHGRWRIPTTILGLEGYTVTTKRLSPHRAQVRISKPIPVVILKAHPETEDALAITSEGFILSAKDTQDDILPPVIDERLAAQKSGDRLDSGVVDLYKELKGGWTSKLSDHIASIRVSSDQVLLIGKEDFTATLSTRNILIQLLSLQEILGRPTIEIKHKHIDLRFQHPVIREEQETDL